MQQLILGTGTAIWWLTEPHCWNTKITFCLETFGGQNSMYLDVVYFFTPGAFTIKNYGSVIYGKWTNFVVS